MVARPQINLRKVLCTLKLIKQVIYPRKRILVFNCHLIQLSVINAQSKCTILFLYKQDWCTLRRSTGSYEILVQKLLQLLL